MTLPKDRRKFHRLALAAKRKRKSPAEFLRWVRLVWPTGCQRLGEREMQAFVAVVWGW